MANFNKIIIPVRPQTDTIIAIFLLKTFGGQKFTGIESAVCESMSSLPEGENEETLEKKGMILLDVGKGKFDHHSKEEKITSSDLVARFLGVIDDPAIAKLLEVARRCDFYGKGTISDDALDRAFGLSGLISSFNKVYPEAVGRAVEVFLPVIEAHYKEEVRRTKDMPLEVEEKMKNGKAETFEVKQRDKKLKVIIIESDNPSLPGFLRAHMGGAYDVVAQVRETGHINILTRPAKRIDLRALIALIRAEELMVSGAKEDFNMQALSKTGRIDNIPEWYYDPATNSIQNGGINPRETPVTKVPRFSLKKILEVGLSEQIWSPLRR